MAYRTITRNLAGCALAAGMTVGIAGAALAQQPTVIKIGVFGGTLGKGFIEGIKPFEAANNVKFEVIDLSASQALTRILARLGQEPEFDLVHMSPASHYQGVQAGAFETVSVQDVPNLADVVPSAHEGGKYVGWGLVAFGIEYNKAELDKAGAPYPKTWMDLWNPAYKGKVSIQDFNGSVYAQGFFDMVRQAQGGDLDKTFAKLKELKPNICCFPFSVAEVDNHLLQGNAWIAPNADARANLLKAKGAPIEFVYPKDATGAWLVYMDIPKGTPRKDIVLKLMNYAVSPEAQARMAVSAQVGPINKKVVLTPEQAKGIAYGDILKDIRPIDWPAILGNLESLTNRWMADFQN